MKYRHSGLLIIAALILMALPRSANPANLAETSISLELDQVPITTVLSLIGQQNNLNIVASAGVEGDVTVRLVNVPLDIALNAVLAPLDLNYIVDHDVIMVKPLERTLTGEMKSEVIRLNYVDAGSAKAALEQMKSEKGQVIILEPSADMQQSEQSTIANRILVTEYPARLAEMLDMIDRIDQPQRLVSIKVKIIETKVDASSQIGFSWPSSVTATMGAETSSSDDTESDGSSSSSLLDNLTGLYNPNNGDWTWGTLSVGQLSLVLDFLKQSGNSKLVSDPHITTLENEPAEIKVETIVPIPTVNRFTEGGATQDILTFQDEEVGISLLVTPRINANDEITLDVFPQVEDIIGYAGPTDNQKPITASRSIRTRITVKNGETAALGGLLKEDEIISESRVPLLGSIPILGRLLFTNKSTDRETTDLLILITPEIIR
ncbi:MAG TPA: hypothetical protein PLF13_05505 [candidate division Zixibacteria bacterium]|nr:hypothetical protein [candidate division Zixibacteria bacterium]